MGVWVCGCVCVCNKAHGVEETVQRGWKLKLSHGVGVGVWVWVWVWVWVCGCVGVWVCGCVGVWVCVGGRGISPAPNHGELLLVY